MGRLATGTTLRQARAEAESLARVLAAEHPDAYMVSEEGQLTIGVETLREQTIGDTGHLVTMLLGATGFLLLIGCANAANLMLARAGDRRREIALRSALGARRRGLVVQLLTESSVLGLLGGLVGIIFATLLIRALHVFGPADFPRLAEVVIDIRALTFAVVVSLAAGMLSGLAPAFISSAGSPARALRQGGRHASSGKGAGRMRRTLIVAEVSLALVLLSGATLLATSYLHLQGLDPGFDADGVLTMSVGMPDAVIAADERERYLSDLTREISGLAGVSSVSCVSTLPVNGFTVWSPGIIPEGSQEEPLDGLDGFVAGPGYFETMGITVLSGRGITSRDGADDARVAVVSATAAHRMWPGENPIGKRLRSSGSGAPWFTVVGLVADVRAVGLALEPSGEVYLPFAQAAQIPWLRWMQVVIRTTGGQPHLAGQVQDIMGRLNAEVPFDGLQPLGERVSSSIDDRRFNALIWSLFGGTAVLLAAVGLYATLVHAVGRRTREIGIRVALGASPAQMLRMVLGEGMALSAAGMAIGLIGTFVLSRLLANLLVGVSPTDPTTLGGACLALLTVTALACAVPARRATGTDPAEALRAE
jgi:putative ABC transport system permease protein